MKIYSISTPTIKNAPIFNGRKRSEKNNDINDFSRNYSSNISNSAMNKAVKAMVLVPITSLALSSCDNDPVVEDSCRTTIFIQKPNKPEVPDVKDTLYMGHVYKLDKVKVPTRDEDGKIIGSVTVPSSTAYVQTNLADAPVNKTINKMFSVLGLTSKHILPEEGVSKNPAENIPLQFIYSNPKTQTVTALMFDGFKSSNKSFAFDSREYNKSNNLKSSMHYDFTVLDNNSLFVEKYDNFAPEKGVKNEILRINGSEVERYVSVGNNSYALANTYSESNSENSIFVDNENSSFEIPDIKITSSSR